ncbi:MAG: hypothetical protein JW940_29360 [Polyangiaceae bacterium]|nr:hypothetical protein [Polyangiaceae bacterium]
MHQYWTKVALIVGFVALGCRDDESSRADSNATAGSAGSAATAGSAGTAASAAGAENAPTAGAAGGSSGRERQPHATAGSTGISEAGADTGAAGAPQTPGAAGGGGSGASGAGAPNVEATAGKGGEGQAGATGDGAAGANAADPVDVTVELDEARAVSATITRDGGTINAVAVDGTQLSLTIPQNALLSPERVTLTPLAAIDDLPFSGGLVAAAHFEPEGLVLLEAATLTLTLPSAPSESDSVGFAYHGLGEDFHLAPVTVDAQKLTLPVSHFSGAGVASGSEGEAGDQAGHTPQSPGDQATQAIANILRKSQGQGDGPTDEDLDAIADILLGWFRGSVMPNLQAAEGNDAILEAAIIEMLQWYQTVLLLGLEDRFVAEWNDALSSARTGILNAIRRSHDRCISGPDASEVKTILRWGQMGLLLGVVETEEFTDDVRACATFELDVSSHFELLDDPAFRGTVQVSAMKLTLDEGLIMFEGSAASQYLSAEHDHECTVSIAPHGDMAVAQMTMNLNFKDNADPSIQMVFWPGEPTETLTVRCPDDDNSRTELSAYWFAGWLAGHESEAEGGGIVDWEFTGGSAFAYKVYGRVVSAEGLDYAETTRLDLYHTPQ